MEVAETLKLVHDKEKKIAYLILSAYPLALAFCELRQYTATERAIKRMMAHAHPTAMQNRCVDVLTFTLFESEGAENVNI